MTEDRDPFLRQMFAQSAEPLDGEAFVAATMRRIRPRWRTQQLFEVAVAVALSILAIAALPLAISMVSGFSQGLSFAATLLKPVFTPPYVYMLGAALGLVGMARRWAS